MSKLDEILDELGQALHNNYPDNKALKFAHKAILDWVETEMMPIKKGEVIPYKTIDKVNYVELSWLTEKLRGK
jgi:hypothetical protein